jgi:hypothetical protein
MNDMTRPLSLLLGAVLVATALAFAGVAAAQEAPNPPDPSIADGSAQRALDRARAK